MRAGAPALANTVWHEEHLLGRFPRQSMMAKPLIEDWRAPAFPRSPSSVIRQGVARPCSRPPA
jgi:hypothetical protein